MTTLETLPKDILLDILFLLSPEHDLYPTIPRVSRFFRTLSRENASLWGRLLYRDFDSSKEFVSILSGIELREHYRFMCQYRRYYQNAPLLIDDGTDVLAYMDLGVFYEVTEPILSSPHAPAPQWFDKYPPEI